MTAAADPYSIFPLIGPVLAVAYASLVGARGHIMTGLVITLLSGLLGLWMWNGLAATCAINEAECIGGSVSLFVAGLMWFCFIIVGSKFIIRRWHGRNFQ